MTVGLLSTDRLTAGRGHYARGVTDRCGPTWGASPVLIAAGRANCSDLRAVCHAELAHDLPNMKFDGTFTHRQPARDELVRIATAQKFEDRFLPRC